MRITLNELKPGQKFYFIKSGKKGNTEYILERSYRCGPNQRCIKYHNGAGTFYTKYLDAQKIVYLSIIEPIDMKVKYIQSTDLDIIADALYFNLVFHDEVNSTILFFDRPEVKRLVTYVESDLIREIHVSSIDQIGKDINDILSVIEYFENKAVNLYIENIGMYSIISSAANPAFKSIVSVLHNIADLEKGNHRLRQQEGIAVAKGKGIYKGRKPGTEMSDQNLLIKYESVVSCLKSGESIRSVARSCGVAASTVQKVKRVMEK